MTPSNPGQIGSSEVLHDGMNDEDHQEQFEGACGAPEDESGEKE